MGVKIPPPCSLRDLLPRSAFFPRQLGGCPCSHPHKGEGTKPSFVIELRDRLSGKGCRHVDVAVHGLGVGERLSSRAVEQWSSEVVE